MWKKFLVLGIIICLFLTGCGRQTPLQNNPEEEDSWGLYLSVTNVTPEGLTLTFRQTGGNAGGQLQTGEWFLLEKKVGDDWQELETNPLIDYAWRAIAYEIHKESTTELEVEWEWLYGALPPGSYRLSKEVMDFRKTGDFDKKIYQVCFTIDFADNQKNSFLATVLEETTTYMIVEPAEESSVLFGNKKVKVAYGADHYDYLYGIGRKVVIYFQGNPEQIADDMMLIQSDDISTEGFREFLLFVMPSKEKTTREIAKKPDPDDSSGAEWIYGNAGLYYYGVENVSVTIQGYTMPLETALEQGRITLNAIIAKANQDVSNGRIDELIYRDGGSQIYKYPGYAIIKYHTIDGNRDVYIGSTDMGIDVGK
ncbi:MAG: hypothetical protein IJF61_01820 [Clostridia bacterium]|nr:hypothetical protein [Clostridia bacterium]